mgnify:FL=1
MKLIEFNITELKMNGMKVGFESGKVVVEVEHIPLFGIVTAWRTEWNVNVDFIETDLSALHKYKRAIDIEMVSEKGEELSGKVVVTAIEEKVFTELTGQGELYGSGVK